MVLKYLEKKKQFYSSFQGDFNLWPFDPKSKWNQRLNKHKHPIRFEGCGSNGGKLLRGNCFNCSIHCELYFWPTDPTLRGIIYISRATKGNNPMKFKGCAWNITLIKLLNGNKAIYQLTDTLTSSFFFDVGHNYINVLCIKPIMSTIV